MFSPKLIQSICCSEWVKTNTASDNQVWKTFLWVKYVEILRIFTWFCQFTVVVREDSDSFICMKIFYNSDIYFKGFSFQNWALWEFPINNFPKRNNRGSFVGLRFGGCTYSFCVQGFSTIGICSNCAQLRRFSASDKIWTVPISPPMLLEQN